ncbi:MAG: hypothetical protein Q4Q62_00100 [Thermoplasmata archaeon]|nr:hypothetical protein [Thermoplasmata archaeon]
MYGTAEGTAERESRLRDEEAMWIRRSISGYPDPAGRAMEVRDAAEDAVGAIARMRDALRELRPLLDDLNLRDTRGDMPEAMVDEISDKLDALQSMAELRGTIASEMADQGRGNLSRGIFTLTPVSSLTSPSLYSSSSFLM